MSNLEKRRLTTAKTRIEPVVSGRYVKQDGFEPNYVVTRYGQKVSRVRVLGTVVDRYTSESGKFAAITLDDGSSTVRVKIFNALSLLEKVKVGDIADVIGRIREYNGEIFIMPEIVTTVGMDFEVLRELEIRQQNAELEKKRQIVLEYKNQTMDMAELIRVVKERFGISEEEVEAMLNTPGEPVAEKKQDNKTIILELIAKLDEGQGCDYTNLLESSGLAEEIVDSVVNDLLGDGVCFEPKPGKIKKL